MAITWKNRGFGVRQNRVLAVHVTYCLPVTRAGDQTRGYKLFSVKGQTANTLGFVGPVILVANAQLCNCGLRAAIDDR